MTIHHNRPLSNSIRVCLIYAIAFLSLFSTSQASDKEPHQPHEVIQLAAELTFNQIIALKKQGEGIATNQDVESIIEETLMPVVSHEFAAYKVLGQHAKKMSKEELRAFVAAFRSHLIGNYAGILKQYDNQKVQIYPVKVSEKRREVGVRGTLVNDDGPDINFIFKMRKMRSSEWKVYDVVAEGISLVDTKRNEFSSVIRNKGIAELIALIEATT